MPQRATARQCKDEENITKILEYLVEKPRTKQELRQKFAKPRTTSPKNSLDPK
jgi:hypothetical protein